MARWPQTLHIQTLPVDERTTIGIIELRICLQAIADSSPELINQQERDFAVYALDYSEDNTPLVGQGMLSWGLEVPGPNDEVKHISGRVTRNAFAALRGGVPENLEVKLKLNAVPRMQRPQTSHTNTDMQRGYHNAPTPTPTDGNSEWSSFIQSNPNLGRPQTGPSMPSPGLPPFRYGSPMQAPSPGPGFASETRTDMYAPQPTAPTPPPMSVVPVQSAAVSYYPPVASSQAPAPEEASEPPKVDESLPPAKPTRPKAKRTSSKAPKKKASTTGAPRGRQIKRRSETGNTSAMEDGTDAEEAPVEGPKKKRAKTTKADWPNKAAPLNSAPGSLRVAASTSGSLRTMRPPAAANGNGTGASHLQEVPRAPTPVPQPRPRGRPPGKNQARRSSMMDMDSAPRFMVSETGIPAPAGQDAHSPPEIAAQSPIQAYTPEGESPADIGSSPPVPRSGRTCRSSPPASSPVLPPMPMPQPDSGFMSGGFDEMVDDDELQLPVSMSMLRPNAVPQPTVRGRPKLAPKPKQQPRPSVPPMSFMPPLPFSGGLPHPPPSACQRPSSRGLSEPASNGPEIEIQQICPGPQELLPKQSIYAPSASARAQMKSSRATGTTKAAARQLKRSNTEPQYRQEPYGTLSGPPMPQTPTEPDNSNIDPELLQPSIEPRDTETEIQQPEEPQLEVSQPEAAQLEGTQPDAPAPDELRTEQLKTEETPRLEESQADVSHTEAVPLQTTASPNLPAEATQEPAPTAPETPAEPEEHLLRLLSEPMDVTQEAEPELPPMPAAHFHSSFPAPPDSEAFGPGSMPPIAASDPGLLAPSKSPEGDSPNDDAQKAIAKTSAVLSKNISRKKSIREKLEKAVKKGEMPTFCSNCGSISTPTWRKIWTQDSDGSPDIPEYSDKPGRITAIIILERDSNGKPTKYRVAKKVLGQDEDSKEWTESILCNRKYHCPSRNGSMINSSVACGLWISKYHTQRPESRWENDFTKMSRSRRSRPSEKLSGTKKGRSQSTAPANSASEAYFTTDPIGADDQGPSPAAEDDEVLLLQGAGSHPPSRERGARSQTAGPGDCFGYPDRQGSTHSRASGTTETPAALEEDDLGKTRRILFPSPKRDGQPKVLGEVSVNIVRTSAHVESAKNSFGKGNSVADADDVEMNLLSTPKVGAMNELHDLFGTPCRPTTPPRKERPAGPFKTPTRPTPSHRPITRSVSKSIRGTARSTVKSPGHALQRAQQTPTKTPRSSARLHNNEVQQLHAHFAMDSEMGNMPEFGTPFSSTLNQLLSEANDFTAGSSAHGLVDFDLPMNSDTGLSAHMDALDFGSFLTTDAVMPSSPPFIGGRSGGSGAVVSFPTSDLDFEQAWEAFSAGGGSLDVAGDAVEN